MFQNPHGKEKNLMENFNIENMMLPTPPRSPSRSYLNLTDPMLDDLFELLGEDDEPVSRKRKLSEISFGNEEEINLDNALMELGFVHDEVDMESSVCMLDRLLSTYVDSPPPTNPPSPSSFQVDIKSEVCSTVDSEDSYTEDLLKDFESFDTFEKLASSTNFIEETDYKEEYEFKPKRIKFDSESDEMVMMKNDCMWNGTFGQLIQHEDCHAENIKKAMENDHNYAAVFKDEQIINFDKIQKKTKILVPLKHLMETLQQKSYLVSPLGPGKKVIRLTGTETVKGVFSGSGILGLPSGAVSKPSNHNVRKRPHNPIVNTRYTSPKLIEPVCAVPLSPNILQPLTKKKTKAHNNMERMRRIDLRNSFDNLKKLVPILSKSPKCSKVEILKKAEEYIRGLRNVEKKFIKEEQQLKFKIQQLKINMEG